MTVVVDGRVLRGPATGIQRVARGLLDAADHLPLRVLAPAGTDDPRVDQRLPVRSSRVWEQLVLPAAAGRRPVLSLANTAPVAAWRSVVFVHDLGPQLHPEWFAPRMAWYARTVAASVRHAHRVLVPSEEVRRQVTEVLGKDLERVRVVRPAVQGSPPSPEAVAAARTRYGLDGPYAVLVGWADPRKDLATALAAHRLVRDDVPHELVLVGRPHPNLAPVAVPDDASVRLLGGLPDEDLRAVLAGAEVLLHPSRFEGFGLPPLEAWSCGTPALIADVPSVREATEDRAPVLPVGDVAAWATALASALEHPLPVPELPAWTWSDAAEELRRALT
jgi:glycosyltransferase involved in cell wall biosynthesis